MDENGNGHRTFVFGDFHLDPGAKIVCAAAGEIHLAPRPFEVLCFLVANHHRAVSRAELLDEFWEGHEVYDDALRKCVASIRKALKDTEKPSRLIETRYGGGYRFIADVSVAKNGNGSSNGSNGHRAAPATNEISGVSVSKNILPWARLPVLIAAGILLVALMVVFYVFVPRQPTASAAGDAVTRLAQIRSIAVMPLKNLTGDAANEYFSDGITESIITELARSGELKVISRGSTFTLKGKEIDPREVGRELGVDALLEGSVQRKGNLANVRVRLVDSLDGTILWTSNDFERELSAAFDLQDVIACNVAAELRTELCGTSVSRKTNSGLAFQEYLKGRFEWNKRTAAGIRKSIDHFNRALEIDPQYALAYSGLSESYVQGIWHVPFNAHEILPKAEAASLKAVELDNSSPEAHTALASVYGLEWKWAGAERELRRALEINPRFARGHHVQAFLFFVMGRNEEAVASIEKARELDPLNMVVNTDKAVILFGANRTDEAFAQWKISADLDPNFALSYVHQAEAYLGLGNETAAIDALAKSMELSGEPAKKVAEYRVTATKFGLSRIYSQDLSELRQDEARGRPVSFVNAAIYCTIIGEKDQAFKYLEKAVSDRDPRIALLTTYPPFAPLRSDPRYNELLRRIGLSGS